MIEDLYTVKSFLVMGDSLRSCYNCDYCRANDDLSYSYHTLPSEINPLFKRLPIAINLFYGDPVLQWDNTLNLLKRLENDGHEGIVTIVTKGKLPFIHKMNLNLHIGISIGPDEVSKRNFDHNLLISSYSDRYKYSIEYRPICNGINDSDEKIEYIMSKAYEYKTCVSYSGLQLPPKGLSKKYVPYDNRNFNGQKYIGREVSKKIEDYAYKYNVHIFRKTSCLISYMHGLDRDYNAHYLKPIGVGCQWCPNYDKCKNFKFNKIKLPFEYDVYERSEYSCSFVRNGLCKVPNKECLNMKGTFIHPHVNKITRGDVRIIKWLTGCMVDEVNELVETPFVSDFWKI